MTTPTSNTDTPIASVPYGPSEIASLILMVASFCNATFGQDYGISKNVQAISALVAGLIPIGIGLFRAIKHHGAMGANALVAAKQLEVAVSQLQPTAPPVSPATLTLPVAHPLDTVPASSDL